MLICEECIPYYDIDRVWITVAMKSFGECIGCHEDKTCHSVPQMLGKMPNYKEDPYGLTKR